MVRISRVSPSARSSFGAPRASFPPQRPATRVVGGAQCGYISILSPWYQHLSVAFHMSPATSCASRHNGRYARSIDVYIRFSGPAHVSCAVRYKAIEGRGTHAQRSASPAPLAALWSETAIELGKLQKSRPG